MRQLRCLATLSALAGVFVLVLPENRIGTAAPDDKRADLEGEVRQLVADLSAETRAQRMAAEKRLIELGSRALPHLPAPELLPSVSVKEAVRRIRSELERTAARESVLPSRVTLASKLSFEEALAEISRQTGNRLDGRLLSESQLKRPADLDLEGVAFWQVLDDLAARFQVRYEYDAVARGLKLIPAEAGGKTAENPVSYGGAFRIEGLPAERIQRAAGRGKDPKARASEDLLRVSLVLMPEPRLRPLFLHYATSDITVRTADKVSLKAFSPEASYELPLGEGGGTTRIQLDFLIPATLAPKALELQGKLQCTTAAGNEQIRFTEIARAQESGGGNIARRRGGVTVTLNRMRVARLSPGKQEARIAVTVAYDTGGPAFESHRTWILHNEVFLEDSTGKRLRLNGGSETTLQGDGGVGIEYRFVDLPDPLPNYTFVYVAPTLIVDVPIEFEIQSVPVGKK